MRVSSWAPVLAVLITTVMFSQDKAAVQMDKTDSFKAGDPISFNVRLDEALPKGARFDFRISPISADEEIPLGSGEALDASNRRFKVSGKLPEGALPGEWHISVIWLFLPGSGWTHNTITPNDLRFKVEGRQYPIPRKAEVSTER
jgi:hypothetical protein